jgi:hypothetical protein
VFEEILARLAAALERHGIPAMVIGGQAVLLYGEPRLTRDIDVTLGVGTDRLASVLELLPEIPLKILPKDVIIHKVFAGRPRDLEDVATIVRNQPDLDRAYIRRWLEQFDAGQDEPVFTARFAAIAAPPEEP